MVLKQNYLCTNLAQFVDEITAQKSGCSKNGGHHSIETRPTASTPFQLRQGWILDDTRFRRFSAIVRRRADGR